LYLHIKSLILIKEIQDGGRRPSGNWGEAEIEIEIKNRESEGKSSEL
jgi:hypothetical protein